MVCHISQKKKSHSLFVCDEKMAHVERRSLAERLKAWVIKLSI